SDLLSREIPAAIKGQYIFDKHLFFKMSEAGQRVVILGGGVIGSSIAYHITLLNKDPNLKVTVVEQTAIGCAAS
ncbi:26205_t:CDS:1, partial [Dentiscutata erythropus]